MQIMYYSNIYQLFYSIQQFHLKVKKTFLSKLSTIIIILSKQNNNLKKYINVYYFVH